jgi:hypothetical protein
MELAGFVSQAGVLRDTRAFGFFWSAVDEAEWPDDETARAEIRAQQHGPYGDRRTELVLIGRGLDKPALSALFEAALLTEAEFGAGPEAWARLDDPFPGWLPTDSESAAAA